jgi:two-component system, NtrC family, response regulator GlrR
MPRILIVQPSPRPDDHADTLGSEVRTILQQAGTYRVDLVAAPAPRSTANLDLIIPILRPPKQQSHALLRALRAKDPDLPLLPVLRAADLDEPSGLPLTCVPDFLVTPLREAEVRARVSRLLAGGRGPARGPGDELVAEPRGPGDEQVVEARALSHLIGEAPAFVVVKRSLPLMARSNAPVLITGETGTGKELCARALHYLSPRAGKPFLPVNCGAIPTELFESELFGHVKGAFTGAWAAQRGFIAEAEGGTLFLDEVEALNMRCQVKLLRFLEDHTYHTLGSVRARHADVWILAASNVALSQMVREGAFRADLFYRLGVLNVDLPPLRERREDIPRLVTHLWARYVGERPRQFSARALEALCGYDWPGNVRELENVIRQLAALTETETIEPGHLPIRPAPVAKDLGHTSLKQAKAQAIAQFEKAYLSNLINAHHGNITRAARAAQKERRAFGRLVKKYRLATR